MGNLTQGTVFVPIEHCYRPAVATTVNGVRQVCAYDTGHQQKAIDLLTKWAEGYG